MHVPALLPNPSCPFTLDHFQGKIKNLKNNLIFFFFPDYCIDATGIAATQTTQQSVQCTCGHGNTRVCFHDRDIQQQSFAITAQTTAASIRRSSTRWLGCTSCMAFKCSSNHNQSSTLDVFAHLWWMLQQRLYSGTHHQ